MCSCFVSGVTKWEGKSFWNEGEQKPRCKRHAWQMAWGQGWGWVGWGGGLQGIINCHSVRL